MYSFCYNSTKNREARREARAWPGPHLSASTYGPEPLNDFLMTLLLLLPLGANLRLNTDDVIQNQERQLNAAKRSILRMLGKKYSIMKSLFKKFKFIFSNHPHHFKTLQCSSIRGMDLD